MAAAPSPRHAPGGARRSVRRRGALAALLGGLFLGNLDIAVVNTAIPSITRSLDLSGPEPQFVVTAYTLAYAVFLMPGARLGRRFGARSCYTLGVLGFTGFSLACGSAPTAAILIGARALQGAFAALMVTQVLIAIQEAYDGEVRRRALGAYTAVLGASSVLGQAAGGLIISADIGGAGWRPVFWINVPVGVAIAVAVRRCMDPEPPGEAASIDPVGIALLALTMVALLLPLSLAESTSLPLWALALLVLSVAGVVALWVHERAREGRAEAVLISPSLLRRREVSMALCSQGLARSAYFGMLFVVAIHVQEGRGGSAVQAGLIPVAWVATFTLVGPLLNRLGGVVRQRAAPAGGLIMAVGFVGAAAADGTSTSFIPLVVVAFAIGGVGYGSAFGGTMAHLTEHAGAGRAADVSGLFNTVLQVGGSVGVALFGTLYLVTAADSVDRAFTLTSLALAAASACASAAMVSATRIGRTRPPTPSLPPTTTSEERTTA
ncbi:MFS transporter [Pimelobacter simplex]|uniref:MFS transporter n=1 Tax=Nocardioides simplex TaxID=2045 RepID=A0A7J5E5P6_NOCSI|nr:MFS transporter [Pimelobacter simplex]KAB2813234.1 MFS transporter [Pimelobacter simplex]